jgi:branched-chain amino acid transport system permease protein
MSPVLLPFVAVEILGIRVVPHYVMVLAVGVLLVGLLQLFFQRTRAGLAMRAVMMDRETASLMGVDVPRSISWTFAVSSALGGAAGFLLAPVIFWSFEMGTIGIKAFAGLTVGGLYSFPGAVIGGLLVGLLEALTGAFLSTAYRDVIVLAIIILMLLLKPEGLVSTVRGRR